MDPAIGKKAGQVRSVYHVQGESQGVFLEPVPLGNRDMHNRSIVATPQEIHEPFDPGIS
jgi:hypothetical protein